jgi:hypothetical protein
MEPSALRILMLELDPRLTGSEVTDPSLGTTSFCVAEFLVRKIE